MIEKEQIKKELARGMGALGVLMLSACHPSEKPYILGQIAPKIVEISTSGGHWDRTGLLRLGLYDLNLSCRVTGINAATHFRFIVHTQEEDCVLKTTVLQEGSPRRFHSIDANEYNLTQLSRHVIQIEGKSFFGPVANFNKGLSKVAALCDVVSIAGMQSKNEVGLVITQDDNCLASAS